EQWVELFAVEDIPGAPVNTVDKAAQDPQTLHNNMILTLNHPLWGEVNSTFLSL
ncbi:MAG: CoA transferase, partial [Deltaproteobacteria bacterium]